MKKLKIISWNINGIRAAIKKGLPESLDQISADMVGLQEIKAQAHQFDPKVFSHYPYQYFNYGKRPGYSGVALFSKIPAIKIITSLGIEKFDREGRFIAAFFPDFLLLNCYFPNGSGKDRDNSRVPFKLEFYDAVLDFLKEYSHPKIVMGDFNTAHQEIDLKRPKQNQNTSGFLPEERRHLTHFLEQGYIDTFRHFHKELLDQYTWWSFRANARQNNVGWRIDYVMASNNAIQNIKDAFILPEIYGSDHCPLGVHAEF